MTTGKKPPFGLSQAVVNKMVALQRKGIEYDGFIKGDDIFDVRVGNDHSVSPDVIPSDVIEKGYEYDFHTHPTSPATVPKLPKRIAIKEARCSAELERVRDETLSPNDAMFAMQYRQALDNNGKDFKSLVVAPRSIIRYYLEDPVKYERYKQLVGRNKFGANGNEVKITEDQVLRSLGDKWSLIDTSLRSKIYAKQDFSTCGDRDRIIGRKKEWYGFLNGIGLKIDEREASFAAPRRNRK
jgi:hypothetical protein